jgi:hypothetical protein
VRPQIALFTKRHLAGAKRMNAAAAEKGSTTTVIHQQRIPEMDESVSEMGLARLLDTQTGDQSAAKADQTANAGIESPGAATEETATDEVATEPEAEVDESVLSQATEETEEVEGQESKPEGEEAPAEGEPEAEEDGGPSLDDVPRLSKEQRQHVGKIVADRIGKLTPKLHEAQNRAEAAEAKAAELEAKLTEAQANSGPVPIRHSNSDNPLREITDVAKLEERAAQAQAVADDCEALRLELLENPEAVEAKLKQYGIKLPNDDYSENRMRAWLERTKSDQEKLVSRYVPQQRQAIAQQQQFQQTQQQANAIADKVAPWLKNPKDIKAQAVNKLIAENPLWKSMPDHRLVLAMFVEKYQELTGKAAPAKAPVAKPKTPAPKPPETALPKGAGRTTTGGAKSSTLIAAEKAYAESSSERNLARLLDAQEAERQRRT